MHQQQHYTLFKMKKVKSQSIPPLNVSEWPVDNEINMNLYFNSIISYPKRT